jgi:hypothetical protein
MDGRCPVCLGSVQEDQDRAADKMRLRCPRCGPFEISGTALAMLQSRVGKDPLVRARLSHAIRSRTSDKEEFFVSSVNLDELVQQKLPGVAQQLQHLVRWLGARLGDDPLCHISYRPAETLAGLIGAVDGKRVERLIDYSVQQGIIERDAGANEIGLSPEGLKMIGPPSTNEEPKPSPARAEESSDKLVKAHCNECGGERNAYKRASHSVPGADDNVSRSDTYDILECCGCNGLSVRHEFWFSEWDKMDHDPVTGEVQMIPGVKVAYWPPQTQRKKPPWAEKLEDELRNVIEEVYKALNSGMIVLSSKLMVKNGHIGNDSPFHLSYYEKAFGLSHRGLRRAS